RRTRRWFDREALRRWPYLFTVQGDRFAQRRYLASNRFFGRLVNGPVNGCAPLRCLVLFEHGDDCSVRHSCVRVMAQKVVFLHLRGRGILFVTRRRAPRATIPFRIVTVISPLEITRRRIAPVHSFVLLHALASDIEEYPGRTLRLPLAPQPITFVVCVIGDARSVFHFFSHQTIGLTSPVSRDT